MRSDAALAAALAGVLLAGGWTGCSSGPSSRGPAGRTPPDAGAADSITFVVDNRNYLDVNVRLFSDGRQVSRHLVVGNTVDTLRLPRDRFTGTDWFRAVLSPVGSRRDYPLPRELFPEDAELILIDVSEHLPQEEAGPDGTAGGCPAGYASLSTSVGEQADGSPRRP